MALDNRGRCPYISRIAQDTPEHPTHTDTPRTGSEMELVAAAPTLDAPDLIATSVGGRLSPAQRRVLGRDLYRAQGLADFR